MININFTNIDNAKLVGRLLPFWARGRKITLLLLALLSPLTSVHAKFKTWAFQLYMQSHITAQRMSLEWYLNYMLKSHFINPDDSFVIEHGMNLCCFNTGLWRNDLPWSNVLYWENEKTYKPYNDGYVNIYAPSIEETIEYSKEDYERDIRNIISKYLINFDPIHIFIS